MALDVEVSIRVSDCPGVFHAAKDDGSVGGKGAAAIDDWEVVSKYGWVRSVVGSWASSEEHSDGFEVSAPRTRDGIIAALSSLV